MFQEKNPTTLLCLPHYCPRAGEHFKLNYWSREMEICFSENLYDPQDKNKGNIKVGGKEN